MTLCAAGWRTVARAFAACCAVVCLSLTLASPARAHAELLRTDPADAAVLATAPSEVRLTFNEPIQVIGEGLHLFGPGHEEHELTGCAVDEVAVLALPEDLARGDLDRRLARALPGRSPGLRLPHLRGRRTDRRDRRGARRRRRDPRPRAHRLAGAGLRLGTARRRSRRARGPRPPGCRSARRAPPDRDDRLRSRVGSRAAPRSGDPGDHPGRWRPRPDPGAQLVRTRCRRSVAGLGAPVRRPGRRSRCTDQVRAPRTAAGARRTPRPASFALVGHSRSAQPLPLVVLSDVTLAVAGAVRFGGLVGLAMLLARPGSPRDKAAAVSRFSGWPRGASPPSG